MVLAKVTPTKTGRMKVGSGAVRFGHQNNPEEYKVMRLKAGTELGRH